MKKIEGKVVVITGASRGIGLAIAESLNGKGAIVYDISRTVLQNDVVKKAYSSDVNDYEKISEILEEIYKTEGKIDVFINNAGFGIAGAIEKTQKENIYKQIETNLSAVISLSGLAIKYLKETKGKLINISSVAGIIPIPYQSAYSATKAGIENFSRALANEVKAYGIKVTAVLPGDTKTGFTKARIVDGHDAQADKTISKFAKDEEKGMSADCVAKVVVKVIKKKHPPLRVTVGFGYKFLVFLTRIIGTKMINFIVRWLYLKKG